MADDEVAKAAAERERAVVAYLRAEAQAELRRSMANRGTVLGKCAAYAHLALSQSADAIERGRYIEETRHD